MTALLSIVLSAFSVFAPHSNGFWNANSDASIGASADAHNFRTTSTFYNANSD